MAEHTTTGPTETPTEPSSVSLFNRYLAWLGLSIIVGLLPFAGAYLTLPINDEWSEILWHGDAFVFISTLMAASLSDLILSKSAVPKIKAMLIFGTSVIIAACILLFTAAAGNIGAITVGQPPPYPRITVQDVTSSSLWLSAIAFVVSGISVYAANKGKRSALLEKLFAALKRPFAGLKRGAR